MERMGRKDFKGLFYAKKDDNVYFHSFFLF